MWSYIKSFFNKKIDKTIVRKITVREKSMIMRHRTNNELTERSLKWTIPGWSQRYMSHTDWTIKIKDDITLPYIEPINKNCNFISAANIPIVTTNNKITFQKYLESYGQYNPNININYDLSSSFNESVEMECVVAIIPRDDDITHIPSKLTHRYNTQKSSNMLVISSQKNSISLQEGKRKHDIDLEDTMPEISDEIHYNICLEIPIIKSSHVNNILVRNVTKNIKGVIVYYIYLDHTKLNTNDITRIEEIFKNFKNEKYNF